MYKEIETLFFTFANRYGYQRYSVDTDPLYAVFYAIGKHALEVNIDMRDFYLDMYVVKTVDGKIPRHTYDSKTKRSLRFPIGYIYNTSYQPEPDVMRTKDILINTLNTIISLIDANPKILLQYIENIEENMSIEATKDLKRRSLNHTQEKLNTLRKKGILTQSLYQAMLERLNKERKELEES